MIEDTTLLVVDDDPDVLYGTSRILRKAGYTVLEAATGLEGIRIARNSRPDIILLDIVLPDIDGIQVCRKLKEDIATADIYVILLSSVKTASRDQVHGLETGADDYISRPIENRELRARVNAFVRLKHVEKDLVRRDARQKLLEKELRRYQEQLEELVDRRTAELQKQINERKQAEEILRRQTRIVSINNRIAGVFLTAQSAEILFSRVLGAVLEIFDSRCGYFGYCDDAGDLICPAIVTGKHRSSASADDLFVFRKQDWKDFWGESLEKKVSVLTDRNQVFVDGITVLNNGLAAPLLVDGSLIGHLALGGSPEAYKPHHRIQLESLCGFISPFLVMFLEREASRSQLQVHVRKLEERNIAMNVLLENRDENNKKMAQTILNNFQRLVFPFHAKLRCCSQKGDMATLLDIIEENTRESLSPLERSLPTKYRNLTPMEIQVADLIKAGRSSKEIAAIMGISERSVFFHRNNIRTKLGILNTRTSLRAFLLSQ